MGLRVRYPKATGQIYDAVGIFDTYNQDVGILVAVRLFLSGSNTYSDPLPVDQVDVIGGLPGGAAGVASLNSLTGALTLAAGSGITISPSGGTLTIAASGGGGGGAVASFNGRTGAVVPANNDYSAAQISGFAEAVDDRVAALLVEGSGVTITYDDTANTLTIAASGGGVTDEQIDDRVNALLLVSAELTKTYNDGANTLLLGVANPAPLNSIFLGPSEPSFYDSGDIWFEEVDAGGTYVGDTTAGDGQLKYGFYWWWDGAYWRSPRQMWNASASNVTGTNEPDKRPFLPVPALVTANTLSLWLARLRVVAYVQTTNNASNYWTITLNRQTAAGTTTAIASVNTAAGNPNIYLELNSVINALLTHAATGFKMLYLQATPTGSPGALYYGSELNYFYARTF